ncbi:MAG: SDR family NAD(P)-dependent oxidoreductase [Chloroflexota bacterium]
MTLENRVFVITGATGSTGRAVSRAFADAGASLALLGAHPDRLSALVSGPGLPPERTLTLPADLTDPTATRAAAEAVMRRFNRLDGLIHLVGGWTGGKSVPEIDLADLDSMLDQHARTTFHAAQAFVPHLIANGWGRIIVVSSPLARHPAGKGAAYAMGKAAQEALVLSLAQELRETGVTANILLVRSIGEKGTTPEELAASMLYLSSDEAGKINGARIPLYGSPY